MVDSIYPVDAVGGAPSYSGRKLRQTGAALLGGAVAARPLGSRSGVRPGTSVTTVTATSSTWTCGPFAGVADPGGAAEVGAYLFAFDANAVGSVTAANATLPRVDIVYVQVDDPAEADGSSVPAVTRKYLAGTAAESPVAPATPARSFVLAQINVPVAGGGSPSVTWVAPYAVAAGGIVPVRTFAALSLIAGTAGEHASVVGDTAALNGNYSWSGSSWVRDWNAAASPFAMASGQGSVTFGAVTHSFSITLPAGVFTTPPNIVISGRSSSQGAGFSAIATSATNVNVLGRNGAAGVVVPYQWIAVQM